MKYSREEIQQYIVEEEVKFIRMAFCDIYGKQKNISIMADEFGGRMSMASPSTRRRCLGSVMWCIRICSCFRTRPR